MPHRSVLDVVLAVSSHLEMFTYRRAKGGGRTKRVSRSVDLTDLVRATSTTGDTSVAMPDRVSTVSVRAGTRTLTPSLPMLARPVHGFDDLATLLASDACIYEDKYASYARSTTAVVRFTRGL